MRRLSIVVALVASSAAHSGCSAVLDFSEFQSDPSDAAVGMDGGGASDSGLPSDAGEMPSDAAGHDGARPDAALPPSCSTDLADGSDIPLGEITDLPSPVGNLPFAVLGTATGEIALAWTIAGGTTLFRAWEVDPSAASAAALVPQTNALSGADTTLRSLSVGRSPDAWWVLARAGLAIRAASCTSAGCASESVPASVDAPFAIAQRDDDFVLVHTGEGSGFSTIWRASRWPVTSTIDLATAPSSLIPMDAAGRPTGYVALAGVSQTDTNRATFLWFDAPPGTAISRSRSDVEPVGSLYVAHDAATDTAIGVATALSGSPQTHLLTARPGDTTATSHEGWAGNAGPVVTRDDGTFLVRTPSGYSLRETSNPAAELGQTSSPGDTSHPVVIGGRYALLYLSVGVPNEINLRVFPCR